MVKFFAHSMKMGNPLHSRYYKGNVLFNNNKYLHDVTWYISFAKLLALPEIYVKF